MLRFGVFNSTLLLNAALLFQEVVCAFYFILFFKIFHFVQRLGGKSACLLAFHLKNSCKIPLLCLSPFQMEAVHVILGT